MFLCILRMWGYTGRTKCGLNKGKNKKNSRSVKRTTVGEGNT